MALLPILIAPDPRLKLKARRVERVDAGLRKLMDDMLETMYAAPGIGLAAPQIGDPRRIIVVDIAHEEDGRQPLRMANPEILWRSDEETTYNEGCLSLPEHYADVERPAAIRLRYLDHENEIREMEAKDLLATVIQHEMDHLEGVLFIDHLSRLKREQAIKKVKKQAKAA